MKTYINNIKENITSITMLTLMAASALLSMGGLFFVIISEMVQGWDKQVWDMGILCFPAGMLALMLCALLDSMVDKRERVAHEIHIDELRRLNRK